MAAPTFVNSSVATTGASSLVINVPASTANGDLLLLFIGSNSGSWSALTGWTQLGGINGAALYARLASSEPASYTVTVPATETRGVMHAWRPASGSWASMGEAIMAYRGHNSLAPNASKPDSLYFQNCDYVVIGMGARSGGISMAEPTGWTARGSSSGGGGGNTGIATGSKTFTATTAFDGTAENAWRGDGIAIAAHAWTVVLRAPGQTTLALKSFYLGHYDASQQVSTVSSVALGLPTLYDALDLLVTVQLYKHTASATFGTPSGWTKKGSDQIYVYSGSSAVGIGVIYKVAAGGDSCTITTSLTVGSLQGFTMAFSRGPATTPPSIPGTIGQGDDSSNDTTITYPAMGSLEDYAEDNILITAMGLVVGNINQNGAPTGFDTFMRRAASTAGDQNASVNVKMNSGGTPGSVSGTLDASTLATAVQFAVALGRRIGGTRSLVIG